MSRRHAQLLDESDDESRDSEPAVVDNVLPLDDDAAGGRATAAKRKQAAKKGKVVGNGTAGTKGAGTKPVTPKSKRKPAAAKAGTGTDGKIDKTSGKAAKATPAKKKEPKKMEGVVEWWDGDHKAAKLPKGHVWGQMTHNGLVFPAAFVPTNIPILYDGDVMKLTPLAEEAAIFWAQKLETDYVKDAVFQKNFMKDFKKILRKEKCEHAAAIKDLKKINFTALQTHVQTKSAERKARTKAEREEEKKANEATKAKYGFCVVDGHKQQVARYMPEPPGLFMGRGEQPLRGRIKTRIQPEDITINISKGVPVPQPPAGRKWKKVIHDHTVRWLASWVDSITGNQKYIDVHANSFLKGQSDMKKFEKARKLKKCIACRATRLFARIKGEKACCGL